MADDLLRALDAEADAEWEVESEEGSLWTGSRILVGICAMAWSGVAFAFFYLRAEDVGPAWQPGHITPPFLIGTLIVICIVAGAVLITFGASRLRQGLAFEWTITAWMCVGVGLVAVGLQVWELSRLGFYPGESGYTSCYVGFGLLNVAFLFGGTLWPEMIVARSHRLRAKMLPEEYFGLSLQPEMRLLRASLRGCVFFWWFMAAVTVFFWFIFFILSR